MNHYLPRTFSVLRIAAAAASRSGVKNSFLPARNLAGVQANGASFPSGLYRLSSSSSKSNSPQNVKKDRADETDGIVHQGKNVKDHERVNSTGDAGKKLTKNVKSEQLTPDDGSMQFKEEISPGSTDAAKTAAQKKKHPKDDVPKEVADKLEDETVDFIKKQSGMSGGASS